MIGIICNMKVRMVWLFIVCFIGYLESSIIKENEIDTSGKKTIQESVSGAENDVASSTRIPSLFVESTSNGHLELDSPGIPYLSNSSSRHEKTEQPTLQQATQVLCPTKITYLNPIENITAMPPLVLNPNFTNGEMKIPNKGFIDWVLNLVGIPPQGESSTQQPPKYCQHCTCGLTFAHKRIVGGVETTVNQYPWMTALKYNNRFYCGASLINNKYLLTAAHCVSGFSKERLTAVFLDHDRSNVFETQTFTRSIKRILRHSGYGTGGTYNNDIALLQLDQEVPVNGLLKPVCLPPTGKSFTGYKGVVTGWGATMEHGQVSTVLREVQVPIMSNQECRRTGYSHRITDNMICAGYPVGMKDSCQGDSGGPMHIVNGTKHEVVGVVSWGEGCAQPNYPGVYARVNRYISWIKTNTRDACYC